MGFSDEPYRLDRFRSSFVSCCHAGSLAFVAALLGGGCYAVAFAQATPVEQPVVITIDTADNVLYRGDTFDNSKIAKSSNPTTSLNTAFLTSVNIGDVRSVNGQQAKGISSYQVLALPFRAVPQPGQVIADIDSGGFFQCVGQILSPDGK